MSRDGQRLEQLDEALRASERRYRTLFEKSVAGVARGTFDAVVLECNQAFADIFGFEDPEELTGAEPGRLLADPERRDDFLERLREQGELRNQELEARSRDGDRLWILASSAVVPGQGGEDEIVTTVVDITDRVEAERALRESESRLRMVVRQMPAVVWTVDRDLNFVSSLGAGLEALGLSPGEVAGKSLYEYFGTDDPEFRPIAMHREAVEGTTASYTMEWEGRSFRTHVEPLRDPGGEITGAVGVAHDVTPLVEAEREVRESERRFRSLFEESMDAIVLTDRVGRVELANRAAADLLGLEGEEELEGLTVADFLEDRAWTRLRRQLRETGHVEGFEARADTVGGTELDVQITATPRRSGGDVRGFQAIVRDVTERKEFERRLEQRALHDQLTGLPNRSLFWDRLSHALDRAARKPGRVAVCFIDLDGFKVVNDDLGHAAGDRVLVEVAGRIRDSFRQEDTVARFGGDEFTVLLEGIEDRDDLDRAAERLARRLEEPFRLEGGTYRLTASIGIAVAGGPGVHPDELVRRADAAMYRSKAQEGTRHHVYDPAREADPGSAEG